ncbi:MAG: hypothetical protein HOY71_36680, partial [Nonomuraea sp.]|nr:hypothetical protein [Nonomuraea sp.]
DEAARALGGGSDHVRQALAGAVHNVFLAMLVIVGLSVLAVLTVPRGRPA